MHVPDPAMRTPLFAAGLGLVITETDPAAAAGAEEAGGVTEKMKRWARDILRHTKFSNSKTERKGTHYV
jgi:hypothetical protein